MCVRPAYFIIVVDKEGEMDHIKSDNEGGKNLQISSVGSENVLAQKLWVNDVPLDPSVLLYAYGIGWSVRWVYLSTSVWIQPEPERWGLDSDTSAEITHLARKPMPYAFSRMLRVFRHFRIPFMAHFMTHFMTRIPRYVYLGIGVIMGNVIKSARTFHYNLLVRNCIGLLQLSGPDRGTYWYLAVLRYTYMLGNW